MINKRLFFVLLTGFFANNLVCMNLKEKGEFFISKDKEGEISLICTVGVGLDKNLKDPKVSLQCWKNGAGNICYMKLVEKNTCGLRELVDCTQDEEIVLKEKLEEILNKK